MDNRPELIQGICASPGIAIGRVFLWKKDGRSIARTLILAEEVDAAIEKFQNAVNRAIDEVESLLREGKDSFSETERDLLDMQSEMLSDPQLHADVEAKIRDLRHPVDAVWGACDQFIEALGALDSTYLAERSADVRACAHHIIRYLQGHEGSTLADLPAHSVLVVDDLSPLEALSLDLTKVSGFASCFGGSTSHAAILARARGIPAVVGCGESLLALNPGTWVILDGASGQLLVDPTKEKMALWEGRKEAFDHEQNLLRMIATKPTVTLDGVEIRLLANIAGGADMAAALPYGAQGAGLFRTEMLFMSASRFPTEDEQFEYYKNVVLQAQGRPITIRTLDIGGDKPLRYFHLPREENPFLGYRAIRISLDHVDRFREQLRALLRAAALGDMRVMFPMIGSVAELRQAKAILEQAKSELRDRGMTFDPSIRVGTMIETPAAALLADVLAKEVDFFSIGTNDLVQYTLAVDRGNEKVRELYDHFHPAVLRLIQHTITQAQKADIDVSLCGEMAGDPMAAVLLVGMGLRSLSVSASALPWVKQRLLATSLDQAKRLAAEALLLDDVLTIRKYLETETGKEKS